MSEFWLGPTYEFRCDEWTLTAGIPAEEGKLEWLISRIEDGVETVSHSFVLEPGGTAEDLTLLLGDIPPGVCANLVQQVKSQTDPSLLSRGAGDTGLS